MIQWKTFLKTFLLYSIIKYLGIPARRYDEDEETPPPPNEDEETPPPTAIRTEYDEEYDDEIENGMLYK